jgi:hypothetical protein
MRSISRGRSPTRGPAGPAGTPAHRACGHSGARSVPAGSRPSGPCPADPRYRAFRSRGPASGAGPKGRCGQPRRPPDGHVGDLDGSRRRSVPRGPPTWSAGSGPGGRDPARGPTRRPLSTTSARCPGRGRELSVGAGHRAVATDTRHLENAGHARAASRHGASSCCWLDRPRLPGEPPQAWSVTPWRAAAGVFGRGLAVHGERPGGGPASRAPGWREGPFAGFTRTR